jgi:hypothetical protein
VAKKKKIPEKYQPRIEASRRYHLSDAHIQMARELGLNPKKFSGLANMKQEPWRVLLPELIEELYFKHFKKSRPANIRSIEQMVSAVKRKKGKSRAQISKTCAGAIPIIGQRAKSAAVILSA